MTDFKTINYPEIMKFCHSDICPFCKGKLKGYKTTRHSFIGTVDPVLAEKYGWGSEEVLYEIVCNSCGRSNFNFYSTEERAKKLLASEWNTANELEESVSKNPKTNVFKRILDKVFKK